MPGRRDSLRTAHIRPGVLDEKRRGLGWSIEALAGHAGVDVKTIRRLMDGRPAYWSTIQSLARALGVKVEDLHDGYDGRASPSDTFFEIRTRTFGTVRGAEQMRQLQRVAEDLIASLIARGIDVSFQESNTSFASDGEQPERVLICVEGVRAKSGDERAALSFAPPSLPWMYCAVRPESVAEFLALCEDPAFEPSRFPERFGEPLAAGFGLAPHSVLTGALLRSPGVQAIAAPP